MHTSMRVDSGTKVRIVISLGAVGPASACNARTELPPRVLRLGVRTILAIIGTSWCSCLGSLTELFLEEMFEEDLHGGRIGA